MGALTNAKASITLNTPGTLHFNTTGSKKYTQKISMSTGMARKNSVAPANTRCGQPLSMTNSTPKTRPNAAEHTPDTTLMMSVSNAPPGGPSGKVPHSRYVKSCDKKLKSMPYRSFYACCQAARARSLRPTMPITTTSKM